LVHLVYWSNARMRAPVVPAVTLLAATGFCGRNSRRNGNATGNTTAADAPQAE
jgi:hypothetical protein